MLFITIETTYIFLLGIAIISLIKSIKKHIQPSLTTLLKPTWYNNEKHHHNGPRLPPSPPPLPIIGHLHLVGKLPHRSFQRLALKYGPIMYLKLGSMPVIIVSSPHMAELVLRNHDTLTATRPQSRISTHLSYNFSGIIFTPYGPSWTSRRKLVVMELMSASKINSFDWLRKEEIGKMIGSIREAAEAKVAVDVGGKVSSVLEDLIYRMLYGTPKDEDLALKAVVLEALRLAGTVNVADYLPFLAPFDLQGLNKNIKRLMKIVDDVLEKIIKQHEDEAKKSKRTHTDLVDVMVSLMRNNSTNNNEKPSYDITRDNIKAILIDLVVPAIDSATNIVKWSLSSLLKHPEKMKKLQEEIDSIVGKDRMIQETDLSKFRYLDLVIKEIFRLYPIIFAPHEAMDDITVGGYHIPKGSKIFLNAWAIGRDPAIWSADCEEFQPERFEEDNVDIISGQDFRLTPFGFGRRRCPGTQLGLLNVKMMLSSLVHCFDWCMGEGKCVDDLVMEEKFGLVMSMVTKLELVPTYRLNV